MSDLIFYALAVVVMYASYRMLKWNARQKAATRAPERQAEAAQRGWTFEYEQTMMFEIERWRGASEGVTWVAEAARSGTRRSILDPDTAAKHSATLVTRWHTMQRMPVSGAVLLLHSLDEGRESNAIANAIDEMSSPLARKLIGTVLDAGLSVRFGKAIGANVEGTALQPGTLPATGYDGYSLMAADPSEAAQVLQRFAGAIGAARVASDRGSLSVLITPEGLALSAQQWIFKTEELVPIVNAGVALAKAMRVL